jgi:hypothetical protein
MSSPVVIPNDIVLKPQLEEKQTAEWKFIGDSLWNENIIYCPQQVFDDKLYQVEMLMKSMEDMHEYLNTEAGKGDSMFDMNALLTNFPKVKHIYIEFHNEISAVTKDCQREIFQLQKLHDKLKGIQSLVKQFYQTTVASENVGSPEQEKQQNPKQIPSETTSVLSPAKKKKNNNKRKSDKNEDTNKKPKVKKLKLKKVKITEEENPPIDILHAAALHAGIH